MYDWGSSWPGFYFDPRDQYPAPKQGKKQPSEFGMVVGGRENSQASTTSTFLNSTLPDWHSGHRGASHRS